MTVKTINIFLIVLDQQNFMKIHQFVILYKKVVFVLNLVLVWNCLFFVITFLVGFLVWLNIFCYFWQWASFQVLCCTNCLGIGILASFGYYVPWFKTREFTCWYDGLSEGIVRCCFGQNKPRIVLLLLATCLISLLTASFKRLARFHAGIKQ